MHGDGQLGVTNITPGSLDASVDSILRLKNLKGARLREKAAAAKNCWVTQRSAEPCGRR